MLLVEYFSKFFVIESRAGYRRLKRRFARTKKLAPNADRGLTAEISLPPPKLRGFEAFCQVRRLGDYWLSGRIDLAQ
jgi:hypothetical protein